MNSIGDVKRPLIILAFVVAAGVCLFLLQRGQRPRMAGALPSSCYVWQRAWDDGTRSAVADARGKVAGLAPLCAEVSWSGDGSASTVWTGIDADALRATGLPVSAVLRIGPREPSPDAQSAVCGIAATLLTRLRAAGIEPVELQIDFDCPGRKLGAYCGWLSALRKCVQPLPVRPTVLPSWLSQSEFARLAHESGGFILQVHATEKPTIHAAESALCEASHARRWVEKAGEFDVPFRVALPTYTYRVAFAQDGALRGIEAEGEPRMWPRGTVLRAFRPNAAEMGALVDEWMRDRPASLQGLLWYRLPVAADTLNWRWPTLAAVMQGRAPKHALRLEHSGTPAVDIRLINDGEAEEELPAHIFAKCTGGIEASDGIGGYRVEAENHLVSFVRSDELKSATLRPGESHAIGWIRGSGVIDLNLVRP